MKPDDHQGADQRRLATVIGNTVSYVTNEALLLAQYELLQEDKFAKLWPGDEADAFSNRMDTVTEHLGGPHRVYVLRTDEQPPVVDTYPDAALREAFEVFHLARKSVVRAHMFMTGSLLLAEQPNLMNLPDDAKVASMFITQARDAFWEHAEAAYIRLYAYWDRLGQLLDFAFFNIRKFEQNGFYAVMERVAANIVPMSAQLRESASWKRLRDFQNSERDNGLKWLLLRRNLIIHSLHLHPVQSAEDDMFKSQFNHLEVAHREKLRPRDPAGEARLLLGQLDRAGTLFADFLTLLEHSAPRKSV